MSATDPEPLSAHDAMGVEASARAASMWGTISTARRPRHRRTGVVAVLTALVAAPVGYGLTTEKRPAGSHGGATCEHTNRHGELGQSLVARPVRLAGSRQP